MTISNSTIPNEYLELLRIAESLLPGLAGENWTDYSPQDPGITILEYLAYALTDVSYRTNLPIEDLLVGKHGEISSNEYSFFDRSQIWTTAPVTDKDYQHLLIDRFEEVLHVDISRNNGAGLSAPEVTLHLNPTIDLEAAEQLCNRVSIFLDSYRNIGEFRFIVKLARVQKVDIATKIHVNTIEDMQYVLSKLPETITLILNPPVEFLSIEDALKQGISLDHCFDGPFLANGILAPKPPPVCAVADIAPSVTDHVVQMQGVTDMIWNTPPIPLNSKALSTNCQFFIRDGQHTVEFVLPNERKIVKKFRWNKNQLNAMVFRIQPADAYADLEFNRSIEVRALAQYDSIQHSFPAIFQLNQAAPTDSGDSKDYSEHLSVYIYLLENIIYNQLIQLSKAKELFSNQDQHQTIFTKPLYMRNILRHCVDFPDIDPTEVEALSEAVEAYKRNPRNGLVESLAKASESYEEFNSRRNIFLDHLLARFGTTITQDHLPPSDQIALKQWTLVNQPDLQANRLRSPCKDSSTTIQNDYPTYNQFISRYLNCPIHEINYFEPALLLPRNLKQLPDVIKVEETPYWLKPAFFIHTNYYIIQKNNAEFQVEFEQAVKQHSPAHILSVFCWLPEQSELDGNTRTLNGYINRLKRWEEAGRPTLDIVQHDANAMIIDNKGIAAELLVFVALIANLLQQ